MSRFRSFGLALIASISILVSGCRNSEPFIETSGRALTAPSAPSTVPGLTALTMTPLDSEKHVGESQTFQVGFVPDTFNGKINLTWSITNSGVARVFDKDDVKGTLTVECVAAGQTTVSVALSTGGLDRFSYLTCKAAVAALPIAPPSTPPSNTTPPTTPAPTPPSTTPPPPSTGPTVGSIVGTYTKQGLRVSGDCQPPLFNAQWQADLTIENSSEGNQGIRMREEHPGQNAAGPYAIVLFYSQFDVKTGPNGDLTLTSGTPTRQVIDRDVITQIELTFKSDGSFTGTETFIGPGPCREVYQLSGRRK